MQVSLCVYAHPHICTHTCPHCPHVPPHVVHTLGHPPSLLHVLTHMPLPFPSPSCWVHLTCPTTPTITHHHCMQTHSHPSLPPPSPPLYSPHVMHTLSHLRPYMHASTHTHGSITCVCMLTCMISLLPSTPLYSPLVMHVSTHTHENCLHESTLTHVLSW